MADRELPRTRDEIIEVLKGLGIEHSVVGFSVFVGKNLQIRPRVSEGIAITYIADNYALHGIKVVKDIFDLQDYLIEHYK